MNAEQRNQHPNSNRRRIMRLRHVIRAIVHALDRHFHTHHHCAKQELIKQLHKDKSIAAKNKLANEAQN